jgi:hypothetical protein
LEFLEDRTVPSAAQQALFDANTASQLAAIQPQAAQQVLNQSLVFAMQGIAALSGDSPAQQGQDVQTLLQALQTDTVTLDALQATAALGTLGPSFLFTQQNLSFQIQNNYDSLYVNLVNLPSPVQQSLLQGLQQAEQTVTLLEQDQIGPAQQLLAQALHSGVVGMENAAVFLATTQGNVPSQAEQNVLGILYFQLSGLTQQQIATLGKLAPPKNLPSAIQFEALSFLEQDMGQLNNLVGQVPPDSAFVALAALQESQLALVLDQESLPSLGIQTADQALRQAKHFLDTTSLTADLGVIAPFTAAELTFLTTQTTSPVVQGLLAQAALQLQGLSSLSPTDAEAAFNSIFSELELAAPLF